MLAPTRAEISRKAVSNNIKAFRSILSPNTRLAVAIKSNAYGHGIELMAKLAIENGVDVLAVNSLEEALLLKKFSPTPIMIMGEIPNLEERLTDLNHSNFWIVASRLKEILLLSKLSNEPKIHLKTDTGMARLGQSGKDLFKLLEDLKSNKINLAGLLMHFASTEDFTEHSYSMQQLKTFQEYIKHAEKQGYTDIIRHAASSASTMLFKEAHFDMVRVGISLYGLWPSLETRLSLSLMGKNTFDLMPVLSWKTTIVHTKKVPTGSYIGYGSTFKTNYPTTLAVIPVGYNEGFDRRLSNQGYVLVNGERAHIIGRVCMNMSMIDITHIRNVNVGTEVVLIGRSEKETFSADTIAQLTGTINYDVVTRIHPEIQRVLVD